MSTYARHPRTEVNDPPVEVCAVSQFVPRQARISDRGPMKRLGMSRRGVEPQHARTRERQCHAAGEQSSFHTSNPFHCKCHVTHRYSYIRFSPLMENVRDKNRHGGRAKPARRRQPGRNFFVPPRSGRGVSGGQARTPANILSVLARREIGPQPVSRLLISRTCVLKVTGEADPRTEARPPHAGHSSSGTLLRT
jgi:hypothetical protein